MVGCGIRNCKNRSENASVKIKFFRLPKNESVAQKWLRYCRPISKLSNVRICQHHFIPSDFTKSLYHTLLNLSPERVRTLKPDAIPSQHIDDSGGPPDATSTQEIDNISRSPDAKPTQEIDNISRSPDAKPTQEIDNISRSLDAKPTQEIDKISRSLLAKPTQKIDNISRSLLAKPTQKIYNISRSLLAKPTQKIDNISRSLLAKPTKDIDNINKTISTKRIVRFTDTPVKVKPDPDPIPTQEIDDTKTDLRRFRFETSLNINDNEKLNDPSQGVEENTKSNIEHNYSKIQKQEEKCSNTSLNIEIAGPSKLVESVIIPLTEYKKLKNTVNKFNMLKNNLDKIFTPGQVRSLMTLNKRRVQWSPEDISAAVALKTITPKGYRYLRHTVGVPLPAFSTLRHWNSVNRNKEVIEEQVEVESEEAAIPSEVVWLGVDSEQNPETQGHNKRDKRRRPGKPKKNAKSATKSKKLIKQTDPG